MLFPDRHKEVRFNSKGEKPQNVERAMWSVGHIGVDEALSLLRELVEASDVKRLFPEDNPYKHVNMFDDWGLGFHWEISLSQELLIKLSGEGILGADNGKFATLSKIVDGHAQRFRDYEAARKDIEPFFDTKRLGETLNRQGFSVSIDWDDANLIYVAHNGQVGASVANDKLYGTLNRIFDGVLEFAPVNGRAVLSTTGMEEATKKLSDLRKFMGSVPGGEHHQAILGEIKTALTTYQKDTAPTLQEVAREKVSTAFDTARKLPGQVLSAAANGVYGYVARRVDDFRINFSDAALKTAGEFGVGTAVLGAAFQSADKLDINSSNLLVRAQNLSFADMVPTVSDPIVIASAGLALAGSLAVWGASKSLQEERGAEAANVERSRPAPRSRTRAPHYV